MTTLIFFEPSSLASSLASYDTTLHAATASNYSELPRARPTPCRTVPAIAIAQSEGLAISRRPDPRADGPGNRTRPRAGRSIHPDNTPLLGTSCRSRLASTAVFRPVYKSLGASDPQEPKVPQVAGNLDLSAPISGLLWLVNTKWFRCFQGGSKHGAKFNWRKKASVASACGISLPTHRPKI